MEKLINPYDKEYMKMAMLKHEETFRNQVYELHRLYEIQKMLMKNTPSSRSNRRNTEKWNTKNEISCNQIHNQNPRLLDFERPAEDAESDADKVLEIEDESEIELTLGPPNYYSRRKVQTPLTSDSGPCFSSSSSGSNYIKRTYARREELYRQKWRLEQMPHDTSPGFLSGRKNSSDVEDQLRQDINQPAWIFQVLNLNMT